MALRRGLRRKLNHNRRVIREQTLQESYLLPGMVVRFTYTSADVYDRRPLIVLLQYDSSKNLIHGFNLNYLVESQVQQLFRLSQTIIPVQEENLLGMRYPYPRIQLTSKRKPSGVDGRLLYNTLTPRNRYFKESHRTYRLDKASSMKLITYKVDVVTEAKIGQKFTSEIIGIDAEKGSEK